MSFMLFMVNSWAFKNPERLGGPGGLIISREIREAILEKLRTIEVENNVRILYACESGSRAWGFASTDSDYDVRFLYVHAIDWYLTIDTQSKRDVIECPIEGDLDINGWELRKALNLYRKSNPPLMEWLGSPIVYREASPAIKRLRSLRATHCSPLANAHHYASMARGSFREIEQEAARQKPNPIKLKKFLYILRPVLAVKWLEAGLGVVPTEFPRLVERLATPVLRAEIERLLDLKRESTEADYGPNFPELTAFIEGELKRWKESELDLPANKSPIEILNELFRSALDEAWKI